jgi:hypothetical protein
MHIPTHKILVSALLSALMTLAFGVPSAGAFEPTAYTERSLLAGDRPVVRAGVNSEGLYLITNARLKALGFNDPSKVRVYGYGGRRIADVLSQDTYTDDLPEVYSEYVEGRGVVFYATGTGEWTLRQDEYWHYEQNPYTTRSYYFISESDSPRREAETIGSSNPGNNAATTFMERLHHEQELVSPGEAGALLVGEDFRNTTNRTFEFELTDAAPDSDDNPGGRLECSFVANTVNTGPRLRFSINGTTLESNSSDALPTTMSSQHYHGSEALARHTFRLPDSRKLSAGVQLTSASGLRLANLNYLSISYRRKLTLPRSGSLCFRAQGTGAILADAPETTRVWDVTDPSGIMVLAAGIGSGGLQWSTPYNGLREYAAWRPDATLPEPAEFRSVAAQNLHAPREIYPQMVIIAPAAYRSASERLAALHAEDGLTVEIVEPEQIYNEFSSGAPDPSGIRRYLKMLYDRSLAASPESPLQYALLFTRPTFDPRHLTNFMANAGYPTIPSWMPRDVRASLSDTEGFTTDDFIAMLEDGSGGRLGYDHLSIAVGRVPVTSAVQAASVVDKFTEYKKRGRTGLWRHRYLFTADDEDNGIHLQQTESQLKGITSTAGNQHFLRKIYLDSYERSGKQYPAAREDLFRYLEEGVVWWNFIGHANTTSWTGNGLLTFTDMNNMYLRHWPFLYTATCDFLRWDSNTTSGGEYIFMERYGGGIGAVSAVRPVYISDNGMLSEAMGRALAARDHEGRFLTPGEIYRRAKNDIRNSRGDKVESSNRLRYVFMGDPALHLAIPDNVITIDLPADGSDIVLGTGGTYELSGRITDPVTGETLSDFNGTLSAELYDAERSVTTYGWGEGKEMVYDDYGSILVSTAATVENGVFTLRIAMPEASAQNYRPAALSLYASSTPQAAGEVRTQAAGLFRELYVYGEAPTAEADTEAPKIDLLALNHHSFQNGSIVNPSPAIIAEISDNVGINTSTTGIGRQMNAILDGKTVYSQISAGYTPYSDGRPGGSIIYTIENLAEGAHSLTLRVWDTSGNKAERSIDFYVEKDKAPVIYRVYTDTNPASTVANFYVSHDRPEAMATVSVTVYNLLGKPLWTGSAQGPSDMFESVPVSWDLTDSGGRRVNRGIYIYRATIGTEDGIYETGSQRIAVTSGE